MTSSDATNDRSDPIATSVAFLKSAADALQRADEGLGDVLALLQDLDTVLDDADDGPGAAPTSVLRAREVRAESIVASIERLVDLLRFGGQKLFGGGFVIDLAGFTIEHGPRIQFPSLEATTLGDPQPGALRSLVSGFSESQAAGSISAARSIVAGARKQVETHRRDLVTFLNEHVLPELNTRMIALENVRSADNADADMEFAQRASRITPIDALLHRDRPGEPGGPCDSSSTLTLTDE